MESAASTFDLLQDISGAGGPDERLGALVVVIDVVSDGRDEFFDIAKNAAAQPVLSQIAKEAFHHIQPGRTGGREVHVKTRVTLKPAPRDRACGCWRYHRSRLTQDRGEWFD